MDDKSHRQVWGSKNAERECGIGEVIGCGFVVFLSCQKEQSIKTKIQDSGNFKQLAAPFNLKLEKVDLVYLGKYIAYESAVEADAMLSYKSPCK